MDAIAEFLLKENFDTVFAVLGNASTGQHMLVPIDPGCPLPESANLKERLGVWQFAGVFGLRSKDYYADCKQEQGLA